jgi:hypothetical protein
MRVFLSEKCFTLFGNTRVPAGELKQAPPDPHAADLRTCSAQFHLAARATSNGVTFRPMLVK